MRYGHLQAVARRASERPWDTFEVTMKTQGEIEAAICEGVNRFEQDYMGRGPKDIHAYLLGDVFLVASKAS
jgi:hypothetical protein